MEKTGGDQVPWTEDGIQRRERVQFGGAAKPALQSQLSEAERVWDSIKDSKDLKDFEGFRRQYGKANPFYDTQAEKRIVKLKQEAAEAKARADAEANRRRAERIVVEKRAAEEARQQAKAAAAKERAAKEAARSGLVEGQKCMAAGGFGTGAFEGFAAFMAETAMKNSAKAKFGDAVKISAISKQCEMKGQLYECTVRAQACN